MTEVPSWYALDAALQCALDLDGAERHAYLAGLDPRVRQPVTEMLRDGLGEDPLLDHPDAALGALATDDDAPGLGEGARVGPYRIDGLVGEGGMGRVYRARRADGAYQQTVALKVVRRSLALAGADVLGRFRRERAVLATLAHPHIARLLDGGETDDGVPYLVTELVEGSPITDWADAHALPVRDRVALASQVARAIDHAHHRLVVHRDLKPSNVLVAERDGQPRPVILDFGVAKLLDADADGALTQHSAQPLTPAYAAPELYDPAAPVTTAVDVYGLGALLYELLTGARPHPGGVGAATHEAVRPSLAAPDGRARSLRGDLDTICLKALSPDPARRYAAAADLADDLDRHLSGLPVAARPDSLAYVLGRLARRHRAAVAAGAVALAALVGGLGASLAAFSGERQARAQAEAAATRATEAATLLGNLFGAADPASSGGVTTVREALGDGLAQVSEVRSDLLRGHLLGVLGQTYWTIGDWALGDSLLRVSLDVLRQADGVTPRQLTDARMALAYARVRLGDAALSHALYSRAVADLRAAPSPDPHRLASALAGLSTAERGLNLTDQALASAQEALRVAKASGDPELRATSLLDYGYTLAILRQDEASIRAIRASLALHESLYGADDVRTVRVSLALGRVLLHVSLADEAAPRLQAAKRYYAETYGPAHPTVADLHYDLGRARLIQRRYPEAEALIDSALVRYHRLYPPTERAIVDALNHWALAMNAQGEHAQAEAAASDALSRVDGRPTGDNPVAARSRAQIGLALAGQGKPEQARPHLARALDAFEAPSAQRYIEPYDPVDAVRQALVLLDAGVRPGATHR